MNRITPTYTMAVPVHVLQHPFSTIIYPSSMLPLNTPTGNKSFHDRDRIHQNICHNCFYKFSKTLKNGSCKLPITSRAYYTYRFGFYRNTIFRNLNRQSVRIITQGFHSTCHDQSPFYEPIKIKRK